MKLWNNSALDVWCKEKKWVKSQFEYRWAKWIANTIEEKHICCTSLLRRGEERNNRIARWRSSCVKQTGENIMQHDYLQLNTCTYQLQLREKKKKSVQLPSILIFTRCYESSNATNFHKFHKWNFEKHSCLVLLKGRTYTPPKLLSCSLLSSGSKKVNCLGLVLWTWLTKIYLQKNQTPALVHRKAATHTIP